ncbi:MAG: hypothetical protein KDA85_21710 [Planctomycetaceae bacterium]|nr:hypothetical protein [Planctomycetaceae bacterium]
MEDARMAPQQHGLKLCVVAVGICLLTMVTGQAQTPANPWSRPVTLPELTTDQLVAIALDQAIYQASRDDLRDLRLIGADGTQVPFLIQRRSTTETRETERSWTASDIRLTPSDQLLEIGFDLQKDDPAVTSLSLETPLRNFEQRLEVFRTDGDGSPEKPVLLAETLLFDYSQHMDVRRLNIPLPVNNARSFLLRLQEPTAEQQSRLKLLTRRLQGQNETERTEQFFVDRQPFRIDRIRLQNARASVQVTGHVKCPWQTDVISISQDQEKRQTVVEVKTSRQPISELTLKTSSTNFSRRVEVLATNSDDADADWDTLSSATLQRFDFEGVEAEKLSVSFAPHRANRYRVVISNLESPPLQIDDVHAEGAQEEVIFLASPGLECSLQYGAEEADAPQYDLAAVNRLLQRSVVPLSATLQDRQAAPPVAAAPTTLKSLINQPWVWGPLIAILVLLFGRSLYVAGRRLETESGGGADNQDSVA